MDNQKREERDFPGSPVVKNPPSKAEDASVTPGQRTKILHASGQVSLCNTTRERSCPQKTKWSQKKNGVGEGNRLLWIKR